MQTYSLDQNGVIAWQTDLYAATQAEQLNERTRIHEDFQEWLVARFGATSQQLDFLASLPELLVETLRDELVLALRVHLPIQFDRQPRLQLRSGDSTKVIEIEKWLNGEGEGEEEEETTRSKAGISGRFVVRTFYTSIPG